MKKKSQEKLPKVIPEGSRGVMKNHYYVKPMSAELYNNIVPKISSLKNLNVFKSELHYKKNGLYR